MNLDKIRKNYQNRFNAKSIEVEKFKSALKNMTTQKLQERQRMLLEQPSLDNRMKEIKEQIDSGFINPELKDEYYNKYVNIATDNMLEIKLINEELNKRQVPTGGGLLPKYYHTTRF